MEKKRRLGKFLACAAGIAAVGAGIAYMVKSKVFTDEMEERFPEEEAKAEAKVTDMCEKAEDTAKTVLRKGENMVEDAADAVAKKAGDITDAVSEKAECAADAVKEKVADAAGTVKETAEQIQDSMSNH